MRDDTPPHWPPVLDDNQIATLETDADQATVNEFIRQRREHDGHAEVEVHSMSVGDRLFVAAMSVAFVVGVGMVLYYGGRLWVGR